MQLISSPVFPGDTIQVCIKSFKCDFVFQF